MGKRSGLTSWLFALLLGLSLGVVACTTKAPDAAATIPPQPDQLTFTNAAAAVGLTFQHGAFRWGMSGDPVAMMGGGLCWLDYNRDGWLDLFVVNSYAEAEAGQWQSSGGLPQSALFRNVAGQFTDVSQATGAGLPMRGNGCAAADFNLDGWTDIYITTARFNMLLWNNRDGTFSEGAQAAGVDSYGWNTSAAVGDVNGDGWPDLFVTGYVDLNNRIPEATLGFPNTHLGVRDLLYLNEGGDPLGHVSFREVGQQVGLEADNFAYGLGSLFTDLNDDGLLDLYVANDTNPNRLYENVPWPGGPQADPERIGFRFQDMGAEAQVNDSYSGMGVAGGDYDLDGRFDVVVTNMGNQMHSLYLNQSTEAGFMFQDAAAVLELAAGEAAWTGWGTSWADMDLDGDQDLLVINGNIPVLDLAADAQLTQFYANQAREGQPGHFVEMTGPVGLAQIGPLLGRGGAAADYDNDGDMDIAINTIGGSLVLLRNDGATGNWLQVQLGGFYPGTVCVVVLPDGQELRREVHAGSSYLSSEDQRCHFGLGAAAAVDLTIYWPGGQQTVLTGVAANQRLGVHP